MPTVEVSEDIHGKVNAFTRVIDAILGQGLESESAYLELLVFNGIEKVLQDLFPKEELLLKTMIKMFNEDPEFVSEFIAKTMKEGQILQEEGAIELRERLKSYIT
nr:hypothetical protein [Candidatus Njordarchaeota archaeon]